MASDLDYQALFAKSIATAPRVAAGQLYGTNTFASMVLAEYLEGHLEQRVQDIVHLY